MLSATAFNFILVDNMLSVTIGDTLSLTHSLEVVEEVEVCARAERIGEARFFACRDERGGGRRWRRLRLL